MLAPMIPDNAPFSPEQRAWLNGFFAGLLSLDGSPAARRCCAAAPPFRRSAPLPRPPPTLSPTATTAKRPGTTRPSRSPNA